MSIYRRAMGEEFDGLHPKIQERFGFDSTSGIASVGRGTMETMERGAWWTVPFLWVGSLRSIMFPDRGTNVPFSVHNYAYQDRFGRETVTWVRYFEFPDRRRHFDATMVYSEKRQTLIDYIGDRQHLAVEIECSVDPETKGMHLHSGDQRFYESRLAFNFPLFASGVADVVEWYDDAAGEFRIRVDVRNKYFGLLFSYRGRFEAEFFAIDPEKIPPFVKPLREESRE
jgi:hypothetical protein